MNNGKNKLSLKLDVLKVLTPKEYISAFLAKDLRVDKRNLAERRKFVFQFGK
jgi:hypothetical protein